MGNVVFAAPSIVRFHLHDTLARQLLRRGHRVTVLAEDPVTERFYARQGMRTLLLPVSRSATFELRGMPLQDAARRDAMLAGLARAGELAIARRRLRLRRMVPGLLRFFAVEAPDLVLFHERRSGLHRLIDHVAREFGSDVLHTGGGLLPGTMQWDEYGVDGDSSKLRCEPADYARQPRDEMFLMAALAAVLGEAHAPALERTQVNRPALWTRARAGARALGRGQLGAARHAMSAWRRSLAPSERRADRAHNGGADALPDGPFLAVLLQPHDCARVRLDAIDAPSHADLIVAARAATLAVDAALPLVVVPPRNGRPGGQPSLDSDLREQLRRRGVQRVTICDPRSAIHIATTALAVVTINHPHALAAMLAGTPVLHVGTALYGVSGVSYPTTLDRLRIDLPRAVCAPGAPHRESYLTRALVYDHVWCDPDAPDQNGLGGIVQHVEHRVAKLEPQASSARHLDYRAGPVWPLIGASEL